MQFRAGNHNVLENCRLRNLAAFEEHCGQDDALIATQYPDHFVLHHRDCRIIQKLLRDHNVDLKDWPKYGTYVQDFPTFQNAAGAAHMEITFTCPSPTCRRGLQRLIGV